MTYIRSEIDTPLGPLTAIASDAGLAALDFGHRDRSFEPFEPTSSGSHPVIDQIALELDAYFTGELTAFTVPLDLHGTPFQVEVWRALLEIPTGETRSYVDIARAVGKPAASRAVGLANGRNRIAIVVPCHRVIGADGRLIGYGGGLDRKRWLLEHEGAHAEAALFDGRVTARA
ncbi:MAG: cysteine methyltransferase [Phycisphaerae bacterium]|nr:cysteine methyltransferase [Phycisphaerae bacterium]